MADIRTGAIILAAGLSTRMGEFKPLLSIGPKTLLGHAISLFQTNGIDDIVVVTGDQTEDLRQELDRYPCRSVLNENLIDGMYSSVREGVKAIGDKNGAFFLLPVDIPLVSKNTIRDLMKAMEQNPNSLVFYPEYQARRGHPPLIMCDLAAAILSYDGQGGLRALLKRYQQQSLNVVVDDPFILLDADTKNDLAILQKEYLQRSL
jgi:CTP:molybdopterin cytidylyltransferase MocA